MHSSVRSPLPRGAQLRCCRPTRPSIRATRVDRCSTCAAKSSASTPPSTPTPDSRATSGSASRSRATPSGSCCRSCGRGKITRGRIGVSVGAIDRDAVDEFGLKDRKGAVVQAVTPDSAASKAGLEPGDVIIAFGGKPVSSRDELVRMVVNTRPGTTVPLAHRAGQAGTDDQRHGRGVGSARRKARRAAAVGDTDDPAQETSSGFGITLQNVTPEIARRLRLENRRGAVVTDIEQGSPAARAGMQPVTSSCAWAGSRSNRQPRLSANWPVSRRAAPPSCVSFAVGRKRS